MTDHKALTDIRCNPYFENNRINRWIEKIQEFDFTIEYVKGELMMDVDALSREFESEEDKEKIKFEELKRKELTEKQRQGKNKKRTVELGSKKFWEFSSRERREILGHDKRKEEILRVHEELDHRGVKGTYYDLKQRYYWSGKRIKYPR
ncbi:hypothetical protein NGRA_1795 [Nosema granulosis]|uniref:Uncharacterized protein n=1 Tax=Nosema granulosis TaxID=83296 RepID=A0A9P6GXU7_9MICR|nr:hypothetical protein NGRA_1795 [Nosema granulosis]